MPINTQNHTPAVTREQFDQFVEFSNRHNASAKQPSWTAKAENIIVTSALLAGTAYALYQNQDTIREAGQQLGVHVGRALCVLKLAMQGPSAPRPVLAIDPPPEAYAWTAAKTAYKYAGTFFSNTMTNLRWVAHAYSLHTVLTKNTPLLLTLGTVAGLTTGIITKPFTFTASVIKENLFPKANSNTSEKVAKVAVIALMGAGLILALGCLDEIHNFVEKGTCPESYSFENPAASSAAGSFVSGAIGSGKAFASESAKSIRDQASNTFTDALSVTVGNGVAALTNFVGVDPGRVKALWASSALVEKFKSDACVGNCTPVGEILSDGVYKVAEDTAWYAEAASFTNFGYAVTSSIVTAGLTAVAIVKALKFGR